MRVREENARTRSCLTETDIRQIVSVFHRQERKNGAFEHLLIRDARTKSLIELKLRLE